VNAAGILQPPDAGVATEPQAGSRATASVGMAIALGALTMTFATVLLAYAIVRAQAVRWPPPGEAPVAPAWPWPLAATAAALAGSTAMSIASRTIRRSKRQAADQAHPTTSIAATATTIRQLKPALRAAAAAGVIFIAIQISGWVSLNASGIRPSDGIVASVVYALTIFHALHALAALLVLLPVLWRVSRGSPGRASALAAVSSFWHFVTIAWLVVFLAVFVA
jgi:heme/copper-type cytochrome/quinol oxidase subunit 3